MKNLTTPIFFILKPRVQLLQSIEIEDIWNELTKLFKVLLLQRQRISL